MVLAGIPDRGYVTSRKLAQNRGAGVIDDAGDPGRLAIKRYARMSRKKGVARTKKRRQRRCAGGQFIGSTMGGFYASKAKKSRRKTFRTKTAALKGKPGNMSIYKVKGGYRRSKRREPAPF